MENLNKLSDQELIQRSEKLGEEMSSIKAPKELHSIDEVYDVIDKTESLVSEFRQISLTMLERIEKIDLENEQLKEEINKLKNK
jgi:hypothetical protein